MKHLKLAALAAPALLTFGGAAMAQDEVKPKPFAVEVGGVWWANGDTQDWVDDWGWRVGLRYDLNLAKMMKGETASRLVTSVSLSYSADFGGDGNVSAVPILLEVRYPFSKPEDAMQWYAGAGIGASWVDGKVTNIVNGSTIGDLSSDSWNFAGALFAGADFGKGMYTELRYNWNGDTGTFGSGEYTVDGLDASNVSLSVGFRF